ncbi:MAG TPA: hypothetical protein VE953_11020 [Terriglobales bacterium]|nr:hypothetical protein [Terriglobales bacterium]
MAALSPPTAITAAPAAMPTGPSAAPKLAMLLAARPALTLTSYITGTRPRRSLLSDLMAVLVPGSTSGFSGGIALNSAAMARDICSSWRAAAVKAVRSSSASARMVPPSTLTRLPHPGPAASD